LLLGWNNKYRSADVFSGERVRDRLSHSANTILSSKKFANVLSIICESLLSNELLNGRRKIGRSHCKNKEKISESARNLV
jgi:hypothetical protein